MQMLVSWIIWYLLDQDLSEIQTRNAQLKEGAPFHQWEACLPLNED